MKKIICLILVFSILSFSAVGLAQNEITVLLDGEKIEFDVLPQIINDRTMVPMRALEGFNIKSFESIILMNIIFFVIALLARYLPIKIKEFNQKRRNIKKKKLISELRKNYKKYS